MCWDKIEKAYIDGLSPQEIAEKYPQYKKTAKNISDKAYAQKWKAKKSRKKSKKDLKTEIIIESVEKIKEEAVEKIVKELKKTDLAALIADEELLKIRLKLQRARRAFGTIQSLYDDNGRLKAIKDLTEDEAALIAGLKVNNRFAGRGDEAENWQEQEFKLINADNSLEALEKMLGMYEKDNKQQNAGESIVQAVVDGTAIEKWEQILRAARQ